MGFSELVLLGAIAGFTIYLGLPAGRLGGVDERVRVALPMFSVGILAFIFMDVTKHGQEIVDATLGGLKDHRTSLLHVVGLFSLLAAGFTAGTAGIATIQRSLRGRRPSNPPIAGGSTATAFTARELAAHADDTRRAALQTGMTIAAAIGLHNFAEGLAIGVSAKAGAIGLATGLIVGYQVHSDPLELCFYALAGGAILYVVGEIWTAVRRCGYRTLGLYLLAAGFIAGAATDLIVSYGGA